MQKAALRPCVSQRVLLQPLHVLVDALELTRDVDALGTFLYAGAAADAMVGLTEGRDGLVVLVEERAAQLGVLRVLAVGRQGHLGDTPVVVGEDGGDVDAVGTGHAVLAVVAGDERVLLDELGSLEEEVTLLVGEGYEGAEGVEVVLQVLHIGHAAEGCEHAFGCAGKAECPGGDATLGLALLQTGHDVVGHLGEASAEQRLHDDDGDAAVVEVVVEFLGGGIGELPVGIVHLNLHEVPMVLVVERHEAVPRVGVAVEGEAEIANLSLLALFQKEVHHAVIDIAAVEGRDASSSSDGVEKIVVNDIDLKLAEGLLVHGHTAFAGIVAEVRELSGYIIFVAGMACEGDTGSCLTLSLQIDGRAVEVVDAVLDGVIDEGVDGFLVDDVASVLVLFHGPAHAAVAEDGDLVARVGVDAVGHAAFSRLLTR